MTLETPRTALLNLAPVPGIWPYLLHSTDLSEVWVFPAIQVGFSLPGAAGTAKRCASHKIWPAARKPPKSPRWALKRVEFFFEKVCNFSAPDEGDCQTAWVFDHWDPFGRQRRAWPHAADSPHFHVHRGKIGQFFEVWVFPGTNAGLCADSPQNTTGDLQNTPGTPAMHFSLVAAGSQSAL